MSVILQDLAIDVERKDKIMILCKGADSIVEKLLSDSANNEANLEVTKQKIEQYA
jgi:magnesium-transporting ATPase (P-type)